MGDWSRQFEQTYQVIVPDDLRAWLDDGLWQEPIGAEFCHPLPPPLLLAPTREQIWTGLTPPDALPLIGNDYGDWLCLRLGLNNQIVELIRWSHAGGDWMPYGNSLSEALLFDAALRVAYPRRPEFTGPELPHDRLFGGAAWAAEQLRQRGQAIERFWLASQQDTWRRHPAALFQQLLDADCCVVPAATELALASLHNPLKERATPKLAMQVGRQWEPDFICWLLDAELMPQELVSHLASQWQLDAENVCRQDWANAEKHALRVLDRRGDLAWAGDIAGWAAERRGEPTLALERYARGCLGSAFTDDSVRFRTQWYPPSFAKFSVFRWHTLLKQGYQPPPVDAEQVAYLEVASRQSPADLRTAVTQHWRHRAVEAARNGDQGSTYRALIAAGWDIGMSDLNAYRPLLEEIKQAARQAGAGGLATLAQKHLQADTKP